MSSVAAPPGTLAPVARAAGAGLPPAVAAEAFKCFVNSGITLPRPCWEYHWCCVVLCSALLVLITVVPPAVIAVAPPDDVVLPAGNAG